MFSTSTRREAVNLALGDERCVRSYPRLIDIEMLKSVLFLMLPLHVFLFIAYWIPPDVKQTVCPSASTDEERAQIEAPAILRDDEINGLRFIVACR